MTTDMALEKGDTHTHEEGEKNLDRLPFVPYLHDFLKIEYGVAVW